MDRIREKRRFHVRAETVEPESGGWSTSLVRVFDGDVEIGQYRRNLAGWAESTFEPFEWNGEWFALYSPDYTGTRVMTLPACKDLGGEEPDSYGFCPVEFFVPRYREVTTQNTVTGEPYVSWQFANEPVWIERSPGREESLGPWVTVPTGFIAGCIWGDDRTWKLECVDLARAVEGEIVRSARFGHVELADDRSLAESLQFDRFPPLWDLRMSLVRQETRDVATGALIDPYDQ